MQWIKVLDDLPKDQELLIVFDGEDQYFAKFIERKDKRLKKRQGTFEIYGDDFYCNEITHWMIAPEDPKEE